nr:hypothetical protein BaRGS_026240 [Batillaria attramentaria]
MGSITADVDYLETDEWKAIISVDGVDTLFKLDTGAAVTIIGENDMPRDVQLQPADRPLKGPGDTKLTCMGKFEATLKYKDSCLRAVRICIDLTNLNKPVKREVHPIASVEESLAQIHGSKIFTRLDAKSAFHQFPLDEASRLLTTFVTPFGRYCMNSLPYGICSASEIFQAMSNLLEGIDGVICHMDDILVHASDQVTHDKILRLVLARLQSGGLTLNEKCEFSKTSVKFLGHIIDENGIRPDPEKVAAIQDMPAPQCITELQRFFGMVNFLAKFVPNLASVTEPLRQLLRADTAWSWESPQQEAFEKVKNLLSSHPVLAHYSPQRETIVAADASNNGLGAVLFQIQDNGQRRPVAYASRSLAPAETRYATIEKEALAATWAVERFHDYLMGMEFAIETHHKPLVPLLGSTEISKMPPRIQRFRLRLMSYQPKLIHVAGKQQITADTLSRAPAKTPDAADLMSIQDVSAYTQQTIQFLPASQQKLQEIQEKQHADAETHQVIEYCLKGKHKFDILKVLYSGPVPDTTCWYNLAESNHHETTTHLMLTHLLMESFCLATHRHLDVSHPVFRLLWPHFHFLMAINAVADKTLLLRDIDQSSKDKM